MSKKFEPLYRALNDQEEFRILKEEPYLGNTKEIGEYTDVEKSIAFTKINSHLLNGNKIKNELLLSVTSDFQVALKFAQPHVLKEKHIVNSVKINRSTIAVFDSEKIKKNILPLEDIYKYHSQNKGIGATPENYAKHLKEQIVTGKIKEFYTLNKLHQDILYLYENDKDMFENILFDIISPSQQELIDNFLKQELNDSEKIIYELFYVQNLNFYEIAAPLYYDNADANIYCVYEAIFNTLNQILSKLHSFLNIPNKKDYIKNLFELYIPECNVLCINEKGQDDCNSLNLNILLLEYPDAVAVLDLGNEDKNIILKFEKPSCRLNEYLEYKLRNVRINADWTDKYPLFLFLPAYKRILATFPQFYSTRNKTNVHFFNNLFDKKIYVGKSWGTFSNGDIFTNESNSSAIDTYFDLSLFYSELYIPPYYTSLKPTFFLDNTIEEDCVNFMPTSLSILKEKEEWEGWKYPLKHRELFKELNNTKLRENSFRPYTNASYTDRLVKVFGGIKLTQENEDYIDVFRLRVEKRNFNSPIINELKLKILAR